MQRAFLLVDLGWLLDVHAFDPQRAKELVQSLSPLYEGGGGGAGGRDAKAGEDKRPVEQGQALRQAQGGVREAGDQSG